MRGRLLKEPQEFFKRLRVRLQINQDTSRDSLERLAAASHGLGDLNYQIGDLQEAGRAYEESLPIQERLARDYPAVIQVQRDLGQTNHDIGLQQLRVGRLVEALAANERARAIRERLAQRIRRSPSSSPTWPGATTASDAFRPK